MKVKVPVTTGSRIAERQQQLKSAASQWLEHEIEQKHLDSPISVIQEVQWGSMNGMDDGDQGLNAENATTELCPPNPNEFEMAAIFVIELS